MQSFPYKLIQNRVLKRTLTLQVLTPIEHLSPIYTVIETFQSCGGTFSYIKCNEEFWNDENLKLSDLNGPFTTPIEMNYCKECNMSNKRALTFLGGRLALKNTINFILPNSNSYDLSILKNSLGAPDMPSNITGSITHKNNHIIAGSKIDSVGHLGIDLERTKNKAWRKLKERILSKNEIENLNLKNLEHDILLRFSFKEAIFKALNPILKRYIGFLEVEVFPLPDGNAKILFHITENSSYVYQAQWKKLSDDMVFTCVYISCLTKI